MRARPHRRQKQITPINQIDQQPVRFDMAFPVAGVVSGQRVILDFRRKLFSSRDVVEDGSEFCDVLALSRKLPDVLFRLRGISDRKHESVIFQDVGEHLLRRVERAAKISA